MKVMNYGNDYAFRDSLRDAEERKTEAVAATEAGSGQQEEERPAKTKKQKAGK